jgi:uncharacterized protein (TIGR02284 family)
MGRGVFAISLTLPAAKENRPVSCRTLPTCFCQTEIETTPFQEKTKMPNPSHTDRSIEDSLYSVIEVLLDSQEGFQKIGEEIKDPVVRAYLLDESLRRAEFRGELETLLRDQGIHDIKEKGTAAGSVRRVWGELKAKMGGGDHTLLATAEEGEDAAVQAYDEALANTDLPLPVRQTLSTQNAHINASHDYIKAARDNAK